MQNHSFFFNYNSGSVKVPGLKYSLLSLFLFLLVFLPAPCQTAEENPTKPIQDAVEEILTILRENDDQKWIFTREKISAIIQKRFDFLEQSRLVLGSYWDERSHEEKEHFIAQFSKLQEHVYLNRLKDYSGETVQFSKQLVKGDKALVFSEIIQQQGEIPMVYRMAKKEGKWLVYDVIIDGVSLVKNYRKQFASIIEKDSYAGLVREMDEKLNKIKVEENSSNSTQEPVEK